MNLQFPFRRHFQLKHTGFGRNGRQVGTHHSHHHIIDRLGVLVGDNAHKDSLLGEQRAEPQSHNQQ